MLGSINTTRRIVLALFALAVIAAQPALAFMPVGQNDTYEIALPAYDLHGFTSETVSTNRQLTEQTLGERYDSRWSVYSWNPQTGTPRFVYGTAPKLVSSVTTISELESTARRVVADNVGVLRADNSALRLADAPNALGKWAAHFQQTYNGLDVWEGKVLVILSEDGKLVLMGSDYYEGIDVDSNPSINLAAAEMIAKASLPYDPATDGIEPDGKLLILPRSDSPTSVSHHLVWRVRVHTEKPIGTWVTHVDAHTGEIIWRYNDIHFAYNGDTDTGTEPITYCDGEIRDPVPYLRVTVNNVGNTTSDSDGNWSIAGGSGDRVIGADLYGPYCNVNSQAPGGQAQYGGMAQEGVPHSVIFDDGNSHQDERDVFDGVNDIHDFFQVVAPEFNLPNNRMTANVGINDNCNAYWNGSINFFTEGGGCANTGEIQGVVQHEFGHGIQAAILGWQGNEGLGEGNSDVIATLMTDESIIGRGFNLGNCTSGIRNALNSLQYPEDLNGSVHHDGQIIAGFHWDALELLQSAFGDETGTLMMASTWHYGRVLTHPSGQVAQVLGTFMADDDDNNLGNGTPNYAAYCAGATNHNFDCPPITEGVLMTHTSLDDSDDPASNYAIVVSVLSTEGDIVDSSVKMHWRHNGGAWTETSLTAGAFGDDFTGVLAAQPYGHVEYYFYAEDDGGNIGTLPYGAPAGVFVFDVAFIADHAEVIGGWSVGDPTDAATSGIWENVDPIGTSAQPEDDHTNYGTNGWITGPHTPRQAEDYRDVDGGKTTLYSPVYDLSMAESVQVSFWYWLEKGIGDIILMKISNDGGTNFWSIGTFLSSTGGWRNISFDLANYFDTPGELKFMFAAADNGPESLMEAGIDDMTILADMSVNAPDDGFSVGFPAELAQNHPNPFNPATEIKFTLAESGPVSLKVFDAQGRLVREIGDGHYGAGQHAVIWNGMDSQGQSVASGVYLYRLEAAGKQLSRRMLLIK